jgi:hypothetical protein
MRRAAGDEGYERGRSDRPERHEPLGGRLTGGLSGELALGQELADEAVIGRAVGPLLDRVARVAFLRGCPGNRLVTQARNGMEARAVEHHRRMQSDVRDDQQWVEESRSHDHGARSIRGPGGLNSPGLTPSP